MTAPQMTRKAFHMLPGDIEVNYFEDYDVERNKLLSKEIDFQDAYNETKRIKKTREEIRSGTCEEIGGTYNRETQIWCGGWDSQLHTQFYGFSWIAVQGKDSVCVVTQDEVGNGLLEELSFNLEGNPKFGNFRYMDLSSKRCSKTSPFALVSVALSCCDEVDTEGCDMAPTAEIESVKLLAKQMDNVPSFTYAVTVKTAIDAFICLAREDLNMENMKAHVYILRKGKLPVVTGVMMHTDIMKFLQKKKLPKYLMENEEKKSA